MCPGADSASKNEYQDTHGGKDGRCVRLTTYHLLVPNVKKIRGLNLPGTALLLLYNGIVASVLTIYNLQFTTDKPHRDAVHVFKFDTD
jgi:hypothetical protein